jgi:hypothetical protein
MAAATNQFTLSIPEDGSISPHFNLRTKILTGYIAPAEAPDGVITIQVFNHSGDSWHNALELDGVADNYTALFPGDTYGYSRIRIASDAEDGETAETTFVFFAHV